MKRPKKLNLNGTPGRRAGTRCCVKPTLFISGSLAAVFPRPNSATLELGSLVRWIDYLLHSWGFGQPELSVAGLLIPWITFVGALGFLAAWLVMAILESTGLSRYVWHLPLFFVALLVLFSSLIGVLFFP
ncbi:MAG TPA: DUF1656 domain-containing protein [Terrimicrobiaceae bacterium]